MFESIPDYRKIVFLMFLIKNDVDLSTECSYLENDLNRFRLEFKNTIMEHIEAYLDYIKNEESIFKRFQISKGKLILLQCLKMLDMNDP